MLFRSYYWIGKMTGRPYPETWARVQFWLMFVGANMTFFPQHFLGLQGMPRRVPDYPDAFAGWNFISSIGAYLGFAGALLFLAIVWKTFASPRRLPANPWGEGATTLEWTVSSPPPLHNFETPPSLKPAE